MPQDFLVGLIVFAAVVYLGRMLWMQTRGKSNCGCGKSGGCASKAPANKTTTSSTQTIAKSDVKLPSHLVQITTRDKANLN
jgi:hypothetical protein